MINSFEVNSLLHSSILLSTQQENEQVNNQKSDQITENVHTQNDSQHSDAFEETFFTNLQIIDNFAIPMIMNIIQQLKEHVSHLMENI